MTVDASALVAVAFAESGYLDLVDTMLEAEVLRAGAPTLAEAAIVLTARRTRSMQGELAALVRELDIVVVPFAAEHYELAVRAYEKYGRGRHKASLNFGDCLSYSVARLADDSLLFVGDDFRHTDVRAAL